MDRFPVSGRVHSLNDGYSADTSDTTPLFHEATNLTRLANLFRLHVIDLVGGPVPDQTPGGIGEVPMSMVGRRTWGRIAIVLNVFGLLILSAARAEAQSPVIIPGLPGAGLQSGSRPPLTAWPYSDLPGGSVATLAESAEETEPAIPPFGITGDWFGARRPLRRRDRSSHKPVAVLPGSNQRRPPPDLSLRTQVRLLRNDRRREARRLGGSVREPPRREPFRPERQPRRRLTRPRQFCSRVSQAGGECLGFDERAGRAVPGPDFVVTFGKLNAADGVNIHPFLGGNGINRFMNEAFVLSPIYGRLIPYSTPGAGFSYLRNFDPVFTFLVLDTNGRPDTSGFNHMFSNGATLFTSLRAPVTPVGLPGHQSLEAGYASGKFSPLSEDDYIILPALPAQRRTGSWLVTYGFDQFLVVDPDDSTKGWGIFANISLADQTTNPVHWFLNLGAGGTSPLPGRSADSWGVGYYYLATSSVLRQTLGSHAPSASEQGFELYYNAAITSWFTLSADIQAIDPAQVNARSTFLFGLRAKIDF